MYDRLCYVYKLDVQFSVNQLGKEQNENRVAMKKKDRHAVPLLNSVEHRQIRFTFQKNLL